MSLPPSDIFLSFFAFGAKGTFRAAGGSGCTVFTSEEDHSVAVVRLGFLRNDAVEDFFHFCGIFQGLGIESEPSVQAYAVCVRNDAGFAENVAEDEIGNLSANARQSQKLIHSIGNPSAVLFRDDFRRCDEAFGFGMI